MTKPDADCRADNKEIMVITGQLQNTPLSCFIEGYERLSRSALAPREGESYYVRLKCVPKKIGE